MKSSVYVICLLSLQLISYKAFSTPVSNAAVTVTLTSCETGSALRKVSGLAFERKGKAFVLTSYLPVMGQTGTPCIRVTVAGKESSAEVVAKDWSRDTLLLALSTTASDLPSLSSLTSAAAFPGANAWVTGYSNAGAPISFSVLAAKSRRFSIPVYAHAVEITGGPLGVGIVGGIVADDEGRWLGMVSREYLKMVPGTATHPQEWAFAENEKSAHLIVLPANPLREWLEAILENKESISPLAIEIAPGVFSSGNMRFELSCPKPNDPESPVGPIGGSEGVGVGGEATTLPFCKARLTSEPNLKTPWPFPSKATWARQTEMDFEQDPTQWVRYFVFRGVDGILVRSPFWNVGGLFRLMARNEMVPVTWTDRDPVSAAKSEELKKMRAYARRGLELCRSLYQKDTYTSEVPILLRDIYFVLQVASAEGGEQVVARKEMEVLGSFDGPKYWAWYNLQNHAKNEAIELRDIVNQMARFIPAH